MPIFADMVITRAKIYDIYKDFFDVHESLAIYNGRILAVGSYSNIRDFIGPKTRILDLKNKALMPAFIDAHTHITDQALRNEFLDLSKFDEKRKLLSFLSEVAQKYPENQWIIGHSWDESKWKDDNTFPSLQELNDISRDHPIFLRRIDGHIAVLNDLAIRTLEIPKDAPGFLKDKNGKPMGIIKEQALEIADRKLRKLTINAVESLRKHLPKIVKLGISLVNEMSDPLVISAVLKLMRSGNLSVSFMIYIFDEFADFFFRTGLIGPFGNVKVQINGIKAFADGSFGARTAALWEPYMDDPSNNGVIRIEKNYLETLIKKADKSGFQMSIHAIGDRAIDFVLDAYKHAGINPQNRHRIEHFELAYDEHLKLAKKLGIIVSAQPNFIGQWQRPNGMYEKRLGHTRWKKLNPLKAILDEGLPLAFGSDCMPIDPIFGLWSAVSHPVEDMRLTILESIFCYTKGSAFASFQENLRGSIKEGYYADLVVVSKPIEALNANNIRNLDILGTIIQGHIFY